MCTADLDLPVFLSVPYHHPRSTHTYKLAQMEQRWARHPQVGGCDPQAEGGCFDSADDSSKAKLAGRLPLRFASASINRPNDRRLVWLVPEKEVPPVSTDAMRFAAGAGAGERLQHALRLLGRRPEL